MLKRIKNIACYIQSRIDSFEPQIGIVLGTGLGELADRIDPVEIIDYQDIPDFPKSTVEGHKGRFIFGTLSGKKVVAMQGRFHYYEGYSTQETILPIRAMKLLGIKYLIVSNAAGGTNPSFKVGDIMVINDHINLLPNPLIGKNLEEFGTRFPDMSEPYDRKLISLAHETAGNLNFKLQEGCYLASSGPTFETRAEYKFFQKIGADTVGMSTIPEVIAARHMNIPAFGLSVVTNVGVGDNVEVSTHEDVQKAGIEAGKKVMLLIEEMIKKFD